MESDNLAHKSSAPNTAEQKAAAPRVHAVDDHAAEQVVVVGSGPVGVRFVQEYLKRKPDARVLLFGDEPTAPYNRVQLSSLLAGDVGLEDIVSTLPSEDDAGGFRFIPARVASIDAQTRSVTDEYGNTYYFHKLILATGSSAHVPHIPGVDQVGVYTFRNLRDTEYLYNRVTRSRHVVIVGGGLLGIEAARALRRANTHITLVQQSHRLMNRQLDDEAAAILQAKIERLGIRVVTDSGVRHIHGDGRVDGVTLRNGEILDCDTVLLCTGIRPNLQLALAAGIKVGNGIVVDDRLQTATPDIYAVGECCEHAGVTYGLVNPGFEQAAVAATAIAGGNDSDGVQYKGSLQVSRLKVVGETVCSMGEVNEFVRRPFLREHVYRNPEEGLYRKLVLYRGRIIGAIGLGDWPEMRRVQEAFQFERKIQPWQIWRFLRTGNLWDADTADDVTQWPATAVVCQCNNISQGQLLDLTRNGVCSAEALTEQTGAGSVCGSCKPLLAQLVGSSEKPRAETGWWPLVLGSLTAVAGAAFVALTPGLAVADSVQAIGWFEKIWNDKTFKQITGFSLLGVTLLGLLMSLRKRLKSERLGRFAYWRVVHVVLGALCVGILVSHTGLHLGENLNRWLMVNFLVVLCMGAAAGAVVATAHRLKPARGRKLRSFWTWAHIAVVWPLPVLVSAHIVTVYFF